MKKLLNLALLVSFVATIMVPITGLHIHKIASVLFLLLTVIHTIVYRKGLGLKRFLLVGLVLISFASGFVGMIFDQHAWILIVHRAGSIAIVFFSAIHIFAFRKRLLKKR